MYKDTVKFFIKKNSNDAYPVLKGGKEDTALSWSETSMGYNQITKRRRTVAGDVIEVKNLFNKVEVIGTANRGKGGKLFKCKLYLVGDTSELIREYVVLDLRNEALFSIIQTSDLIGNGVFEGRYALSSMTGTYYVSNLNNPKDPLTPEYEEYLNLEERLSEGEVVKNTLSLNDLIEGHVYTKVSKGLVDKQRYLYMGKVPYKTNSDFPTKTQPVYFSLNKFYSIFNECVFNSNSEYWSASLLAFLKDRMTNGYVLESNFKLLKERGLLLKTSNKFYEDITEEIPFDVYNMVSKLENSLQYRDIHALKPPTTNPEHPRNTAYLKERDSKYLIQVLNKHDNHLYNEDVILYPLNRFKTVVNKEQYIDAVIKDMEFSVNILKNYLSNFEQNEKNRLNLIAPIVEKNKLHFDSRAIWTLNDYKLSESRLRKCLDYITIIIDKVNLYKEN